MGVPLNYPFIDGFSLNHPAIGEPHDYGKPHILQEEQSLCFLKA